MNSLINSHSCSHLVLCAAWSREASTSLWCKCLAGSALHSFSWSSWINGSSTSFARKCNRSTKTGCRRGVRTILRIYNTIVKKICTFLPIGVKNESWFCPFAFFNYLIVIDQWEKGSTVIYINVCAKDGNDAFAHVSIMINDDVTGSHWLLLFWAVFTDDHHCAGTDGDAKPLPRYTDLDYLSVNIVGKDFAE